MPQMACPVDVSLREVMGRTQTVTFDAPQITGGATPVTVTCTPASGSSFPMGTTAVNCAANDAMGRTASCAFTVKLTGFALTITRYAAIGDSITEGEVGRATLVDVPNAYPSRLQAALDETYPGQGVIVLNEGLSGRTVEDTEDKIRQIVPHDNPEAVLLLTGYNDLTGPCGAGRAGSSACGVAIKHVADGLRACLKRVRESGPGVKYTFVSTLTPPGPSGSNRIDPSAIAQLNDRIKQMVPGEGAVLVDAWASFLGHESDFVNVDGLHLRPAGYQALADAFFAAIRATVPQTPLGVDR